MGLGKFEIFHYPGEEIIPENMFHIFTLAPHILSARYGAFKKITRCFYKLIVGNEAISKAPIVVFLLQSTDKLGRNWRFDDRKNNFVRRVPTSFLDSVLH